ncbi:MAG: (d)CMP kinase [Alphaproteobacteria bacterium]|nr:(d)CMP kinase [Alphaproteobacteria bacterium]
MTDGPLVIAIDGPAAAGKGTLARRIAEALDFAHLDTGLLYRAIGFAVLQAKQDPSDEAAVLAAVEEPESLRLGDPALRRDDVADAAAKVATLPGVRKRLLQFQRDFAAAPPGGKKGAVVEGRDIGTVVLPAANLKIFLTAALEIRADRRLKELRERGLQSIRSQLLREMRERDERDEKRAVSPLRPAEDAAVLDTTELDADAAFEAAMTIIRSQPDFADKDRS